MPRSRTYTCSARQLAVRQPDAWHVDQHDAVVRRECREIGRELLGDHRVDLLALRDQCVDQLRGHGLVAGQDQGPRLALHDRVRVGPVVLAERVAPGLDDHPERVEARLRGLDVEDDASDPGLQVQALGVGDLAVHEQADRRRLRDRRADLGDRLDRVPEVRRRRRDQPLDEHLVRGAQPDQARLDPDVACRGQRGLGLPAAGRVVAVGQQDDALLGVVGEQRAGQPQRGADIGRRTNRGGGESIDLAEVRWQALDQRLLAERDDPGHVPVRDDVEGLAQERQRVLAAVVPDRVREVDHEHRREPVDRQDDPETGEREDERDQQHRPDDEGDPPPSRPEPAASAEVQRDREGQRRDQQEQRERRLEAEAHQAVPPASRRNRVVSERLIRVSPSR